MKTNKERLIDLIIDAKKNDPETGRFTDFLAEYLDTHNVRAPLAVPCLCADELCELELSGIDGYGEYVYTVADQAEALLQEMKKDGTLIH